jgi:Cdc6-like AAA superfamily ATPase
MANFIEVENRIVQSGVREIFTPHKPINDKNLFQGREHFLKGAIQNLNTPGQHILLYGDRGVGKSSLANVTAIILKHHKMIKGEVFSKKCCSSDTFESIVYEVVEKTSPESHVFEKLKEKKESGSANIGIPQIAGAKIDTQTTTTTKSSNKHFCNASEIAKILTNKEGMLIIDEFDAVPNDKDKWEIAELIKSLSDSNSSFKLLVVGIAHTADQLTAGHPSVQRCLREIELSKMSDDELKAIIWRGLSRLKLEFSDQVTDIIINISNGYPHFVHLICLKCAEKAIGENLKKVNKDHLVIALNEAVNDSLGTFRRQFDDAIRSKRNQKTLRFILKSAALCGHNEFRLDEIRMALKRKAGIDISNARIRELLKPVISSNHDKMIHRISTGVYIFNDPRMVSYIKIRENEILSEESVLRHGEI